MSPASSSLIRRILAGSVVLCAAWWFHSHWIAPLRRHETDCQKSLVELRQRLGDAKEQIRMAGEQAAEAARVQASLELLRGGISSGPTTVWLPVRIKTHLQRAGVADTVIRMNSALPEPGLAGYERTSWNLNVPRQEKLQNMNGILLAVAEIESKEPFVRILDLSFRSEVKEPHLPAGVINVTALVPK